MYGKKLKNAAGSSTTIFHDSSALFGGMLLTMYLFCIVSVTYDYIVISRNKYGLDQNKIKKMTKLKLIGSKENQENDGTLTSNRS